MKEDRVLIRARKNEEHGEEVIREQLYEGIHGLF